MIALVRQQVLGCMIILALLAATAMSAYPRSFASSSLVTPTLGDDDDDQPLPPYTVKPFSEAFFTWSATNTSDGTWIMNGTFNFSNGEYLAIGLNSDKKMDGYIVICNANSSSSSATCYDYIGDYYSIRQLTDDDLESQLQAVTTEAASVNGITLISFTKIVHSPRFNVSIVNLNGFNRMIFSRGKWGAAPEPKQHRTEDSSAFVVNFVTGEVVQPTSDSYKYVLYPSIALMVVVSICLRIAIGCYRVRISDKVRLAGVIALCSGYVVCLAAYILVYYRDYLIMVKPKASFRATGQGAVFVLSALLLPVGRRFFFSDFFGISPERAIKFHMFLGLLLVLVISVHGIGMWYQYGTDKIVRWRDKDAVSRLPGLLAYLLILCQVSIGLFRHAIGYERFRALHYLYVPILFLVVCHAPVVCYGVIPAITLYFATNVQKRFFVRLGPNETIARYEVDYATQTTILDVVKYDTTPPGSWYFITLPEIGAFAHPFSVYRCQHGKDIQMIRFIIRNTAVRHGKVTSEAPSLSRKPGWTTKLFEFVSAGKKLTEYRIDGPYGILEHNPLNYFNYVLVAGGVGITSIGHMLFKIAEADEKIIGRRDAKTNLLFIWVVSDPSWVYLLGEDLAAAKHTLKRTCVNLKVQLKVFVTNSRTLDEKYLQKISPTVGAALSISFGTRPNFQEELLAFEAQHKKHSITSTDGRIQTVGSAVMYCCGPRGLVDSATAATKGLKELVVEVNCGAFEF